MSQDNILLKLFCLVFINGFGTKGAETSGHAIHDFSFIDPFFYQSPVLLYTAAIFLRKFYFCPVSCHSSKFFQANPVSQDYLFYFPAIFHWFPPGYLSLSLYQRRTL